VIVYLLGQAASVNYMSRLCAAHTLQTQDLGATFRNLLCASIQPDMRNDGPRTVRVKSLTALCRAPARRGRYCKQIYDVGEMLGVFLTPLPLVEICVDVASHADACASSIDNDVPLRMQHTTRRRECFNSIKMEW